MNRKYHSALVSCLLLGCILLSGCVKRVFEYRPAEGNVEIALDWGDDSRPKEARYLFYDETSKMVHEVAGVTDGFKGSLPAGKYRLIVHNTDATHVEYRGTDTYETAEVFAMGGETRNGNAILEPGMVFGTGATNEFAELEVPSGGTVRATVTPKPLSKTVRFRFEIKNAEEVQDFSATLDGVATGVFLATGRCNMIVGSQVLPVQRESSGNEVIAFVSSVDVFDIIMKKDVPNVINTVAVSIVDGGGDRYNAPIDLTPVLDEIIGENHGELPIEIPIEILVDFKLGDGLAPVVRPWREVQSGDITVK